MTDLTMNPAKFGRTMSPGRTVDTACHFSNIFPFNMNAYLVLWQWWLVSNVVCIRLVPAQRDGDHTHSPGGLNPAANSAQSINSLHMVRAASVMR